MTGNPVDRSPTLRGLQNRSHIELCPNFEISSQVYTEDTTYIYIYTYIHIYITYRDIYIYR